MLPRAKIYLSEAAKNADQKKYYKEKIERYISVMNGADYESKEIKANQQLINGIADKEDLVKLLHPIDTLKNSLIQDITHKDILSPKINSILQLDIKRPVKKRLVAVNENATTELEEKEFNLYKQEVFKFIRGEGEQDPEKIPEKIRMYMQRKYQTPAEVLGNQLLQYFKYKLNLTHVFLKGLKQYLASATEVYHIFVKNDDLRIEVVDPANFAADKKAEYVEDGEFAVNLMYLSPVEFMSRFKDKLKKSQMSKIMDSYYDNVFFIPFETMEEYSIPVYHVVWKDFRAVNILTYQDFNTGEMRKRFVDDSYVLNPEAGDVSLEKEWILDVYEGYKTGDEFFGMGPAEGVFKDIYSDEDVKLPYVGVIGDPRTSIISRVKIFLYLYDVIMYRLERLMASDRGRKLLIDEGIIPQNYSVEEFFQLIEMSPVILTSLHEKGEVRASDIQGATREINLSLASDIKQYIEYANAIRNVIGIVMGIPEELEGRISPYMSIENANKVVSITTNMLDAVLFIHNKVKAKALEAILDTAKLVYRNDNKRKLYYILDDLSRYFFELDVDLLRNSTFGMFIEEDTSEDLRQQVIQLAHAALQNQLIDLSDVIKLLKEKDIDEAIRLLEISEDKKREELAKQQQMQMQQQQAAIQQELQMEAQKKLIDTNAEERLIKTKEEERRETELEKIRLQSQLNNKNKSNKQ